jgi:hypothetical protein
MTTTYEWDIETYWVNEDGEIEIYDHDHRDRLADYGMDRLISAIHQDTEPPLGEMDKVFTRLVLVRDSDRDGRSWAYITDAGDLPAEMLDAYQRPICNVPKRFIEEYAR